jgi:hypothetical protein
MGNVIDDAGMSTAHANRFSLQDAFNEVLNDARERWWSLLCVKHPPAKKCKNRFVRQSPSKAQTRGRPTRGAGAKNQAKNYQLFFTSP